LRHNAVKHSLISNSPSTGCWLTLASSPVAELLAHCGFDWLVIDMEHAPNDPLSVSDQLRAIASAAAEGSSTSPVVRITSNDPELTKRAMDTGCQSIIFPNVNTAAQAELAVQSMLFPENGNGGLRGVAGLVRAGRFGLDPNYVGTANSQACAIVQIESAEAVANADAIAAVEGVDCLFIGSADLSASLGFLGNPTHPAVREAISTVIDAATVAGKAVGAFAVSLEDAVWYRSNGANFVALHSDAAWLARGAIAAREELASV
jgi:2-dehydro-3-deoxyglucarate aldolase